MPGSSHHGGSSNNQPLSVADQLMQLDSAITSTLQEIDANFAKAHQIVTSVLLPAVKLYGQHSARTWHSAKVSRRLGEIAERKVDILALDPRSSGKSSSSLPPTLVHASTKATRSMPKRTKMQILKRRKTQQTPLYLILCRPVLANLRVLALAKSGISQTTTTAAASSKLSETHTLAVLSSIHAGVTPGPSMKKPRGLPWSLLSSDSRRSWLSRALANSMHTIEA